MCNVSDKGINEQATQKKVQVIPMDSSDVKEFNLFIKQAARESSKETFT